MAQSDHLPAVQSASPNLPQGGSQSGWALTWPTLRDPDCGLRPARRREVLAELSTCLALCAPSGMSEGDRDTWLTVAIGAVGDIPDDLLREGCRRAQLTCDHPAKIVPAIHRYAEEPWVRRKRQRQILMERTAGVPELAAPEPWNTTAEELAGIRQDAAARLSADR